MKELQSALVTGGAGFIGGHLVERLLKQGWRVRVLDNFSSGSYGNLDLSHKDLEIIEGDVRDRETCLKACKQVDSVFHLAALVSVVGSVEDPLLSHEVTLGGTLNMLQAARDQAVRRFVFSSSAAVYGNTEISPTDEKQPLDPLSPYATAKASGEFYCRNFYQLYGLETVILRYFNVFGPRQNVTSGYAAVIPAFVKAAVEGRSPTVYGDGLQTRDFVYVENVAEANICAATVPGIAGNCFNVAGGEGTSLLQLLDAIGKAMHISLNPRFEPMRSGEIRDSLADTSHARKVLNFQPIVTFEDGLRRTVDASFSAANERIAALHE